MKVTLLSCEVVVLNGMLCTVSNNSSNNNVELKNIAVYVKNLEFRIIS